MLPASRPRRTRKPTISTVSNSASGSLFRQQKKRPTQEQMRRPIFAHRKTSQQRFPAIASRERLYVPSPRFSQFSTFGHPPPPRILFPSIRLPFGFRLPQAPIQSTGFAPTFRFPTPWQSSSRESLLHPSVVPPLPFPMVTPQLHTEVFGSLPRIPTFGISIANAPTSTYDMRSMSHVSRVVQPSENEWRQWEAAQRQCLRVAGYEPSLPLWAMQDWHGLAAHTQPHPQSETVRISGEVNEFVPQYSIPVARLFGDLFVHNTGESHYVTTERMPAVL